jgi:hypothetical protein
MQAYQALLFQMIAARDSNCEFSRYLVSLTEGEQMKRKKGMLVIMMFILP